MEKGNVPKNPILLTGLPDVGLVGVVALSHCVSFLKMDEVASVESDIFPPIVVLHGGIPKSPIRVFSKESITALVAEMAIPAAAINQLANTIVGWASSKNAELLICIGGMAVQNRQDIEQPKVFAALSDKAVSDKLRGAAEIMEEGYIVGPYALILKKCADLNIPAIALLTQSFYNYPDPEAAAAAVTSLNKILDLKVDTSELLSKGEEIRLRAKDTMRRTQAEMAKMNKAQEYEVPPLYM